MGIQIQTQQINMTVPWYNRHMFWAKFNALCSFSFLLMCYNSTGVKWGGVDTWSLLDAGSRTAVVMSIISPIVGFHMMLVALVSSNKNPMLKFFLPLVGFNTMCILITQITTVVSKNPFAVAHRDGDESWKYGIGWGAFGRSCNVLFQLGLYVNFQKKMGAPTA